MESIVWMMLFKRLLVPIIMALMIIVPSQASAAAGDSVIRTGEKYLGRPYSYGAKVGDTSRFDCSSFTAQVFKENGITLPRTSRDQARVGKAVPVYQLLTGDLLFYDTDKDGVINHVGIYAGSGRVLMSSSSKGVSYTTTSNSYWKPRYVSARRVLTSQSPAAAPKPATVTAKSTYTVVKGDTLWKISQKHGTTVVKIQSANKLKSTNIRVGQKLVIPK